VALRRNTSGESRKVAEVLSLKVDVINPGFFGKLSCQDRVPPAGPGYSTAMAVQPGEVVLLDQPGFSGFVAVVDDVDAFVAL